MPEPLDWFVKTHSQCHCCGLGHCYGTGLIPGSGTFAVGTAKKKKKKKEKLILGSSCCGSAVMNPTMIHEDAGLIPFLLSRLRIQHCCELQCRLQTWLRFYVAVAGSCNSDFDPQPGNLHMPRP